MPEVRTMPRKPNILVIFGDDIGYWNISAYNLGMMGYKTPNIDRIAKEGALCTDAYGQQSCTAGRAAFITGMNPIRTGLTTIGMPGADYGIQDTDPTIAEILKPLGYATGQFGKNHLGDLDKYLPNRHGFDEFFGNLYHLNAENEPECPDYPKNPEFKKKFGPRGVLKAYADGRVEDTGPLTSKRMETVDEEFTNASLDFIERQVRSNTPFFCWLNTTRTHVWTFLSDKWKNKTGEGLYADAMADLDDKVGKVLQKLDQLGVADNTIVLFTTDNGVEKMGWPDGGNAPFRGEKGSTWEGGFRVPLLVRWPGVVKPGTIINDIVAHEDWMPTLVAAAGGPADLADRMKKGYKAGEKTFKVHLDGYNQTDLLSGKTKGARREFFYVTDNGQLAAIRYDDWKVMFQYQEGEGAALWFSGKRYKPAWPKLFNVRRDPFEEGEQAGQYLRWYGERMFVFVPAQEFAAKFLESMIEFPPSQLPGSMSLDSVQAQIRQQAAELKHRSAS